MKLTKFAIERPVTTTMLFIALAFFGIMAYMNVGVNMMPKVNSPSIMVTTVLPGATPEELEKNVTEKIEKEVSGLSNLKRVISYSMENVSTVQAEFRSSKNENEAMNEVKEKVELAMAEMPQSIERPLIQKTNIADAPVLSIVMSGNRSGKELYDLADNKLRNLFTRINGVTKVNIIGGEKREIKILADMRRAAELGLDLTQAGEAIRAANTKLPGGTYDYDGMNFSIETGQEVSSPQAINQLMIPHQGYPLSVREFAVVSDSIKRPTNKSTFHDLKNDEYYSSVVTLNILKEPNANEVKLARAIKEKLPEFEKELPEGVTLSIPFDNSAYTESAVDDALVNVILGIILTGAILYLFIGDHRTVIIVSISIPISLIASFIVLKQLNATLNMMTLMSFAVSIGALISNSIVVIENIVRLKKGGIPIKQAAIEGTSEVTMAVIASTGTNLVVFLPMAMMSSMIGVYFVEYALTISVATVFSLLVSFTLTPMLASVLLKKDLKATKFNQFLDRFFDRLSERYGRSLEKLLAKNRRGVILFVSMMGVFIASFGLLNFIDFNFMPKEDMNRVFVEVDLPAGSSLETSGEYAKKLEKLGILRAADLLTYYPRDYEDRRRIWSIRAAPLGEKVCVSALAAERPVLSYIRKGMELVKLRVVDNSGTLYLTFFNQSYLKNSFQPGEEYVFYGEIQEQGSRRSMVNPVFEREGDRDFTGRIVPVYPLTAGISNHLMVSLIRQAVEQCAGQGAESLPASLRAAHRRTLTPWSRRGGG